MKSLIIISILLFFPNIKIFIWIKYNINWDVCCVVLCENDRLIISHEFKFRISYIRKNLRWLKLCHIMETCKKSNLNQEIAWRHSWDRSLRYVYRPVSWMTPRKYTVVEFAHYTCGRVIKWALKANAFSVIHILILLKIWNKNAVENHFATWA